AALVDDGERRVDGRAAPVRDGRVAADAPVRDRRAPPGFRLEWRRRRFDRGWGRRGRVVARDDEAGREDGEREGAHGREGSASRGWRGRGRSGTSEANEARGLERFSSGGEERIQEARA